MALIGAVGRVIGTFVILFLLLAITSKLGSNVWAAFLSIGLVMFWRGATWWLLPWRARRWQKIEVVVRGSTLRKRGEIVSGTIRTDVAPELILWREDERREVRGFGLLRGDHRIGATEDELESILATNFPRGMQRPALVHPGDSEWVVVVPKLSRRLLQRSIVLTVGGLLSTAWGVWMLVNDLH